MPVRVIALGQAAAGDDGAALLILERLREHGVPDGVELLHAGEDLALVSLLDTATPVVLVDAVLGTPPGQVVEVTPEQLACGGVRSVSTHGVGAAQAIELARTLAFERSAPAIRIVAVTISRPQRYAQGLSSEVARAIPVALARLLALVAD